MVILERPYVSEMLLAYLREMQVPVLKNAFSAAHAAGLQLVDDRAALDICCQGARLYTSSENALAWIYQHLPESATAMAVNVMKDKAAMRRVLSNIYPQYFFKQVAADQLGRLDISALPMPFILKPAIGFFSLGVYTIASRADWQKALQEIEDNRKQGQFPESVVSQAWFLLEEYISGDEFAVDVYYDEKGEPVILNIMRHLFASNSDVSDRLYITSKAIIDEWLPRFSAFFKQVNQYLNIRNFPAHVELRVRDGVILPIEFNPMRFAGLCTTDIARHAYGINTVDCYLNNIKPNFSAITRPGKTYSMIIMDKPAIASSCFDYAKLAGGFKKVLEMRKLDIPELAAFAIMFTESDDADLSELDNILHAKYQDYLLA